MVATGVAGSLARRLDAAARPYPKLLILIVAEHFRQDYPVRVERYLRPAGLRRLMEEGAYFPDCRCDASTFTASALATLATGCWPGVHGIVAEMWFDRPARNAVPASAQALLATTLAAQVAALPHGRVFLCAGGERNARLLGGDARATVLFRGAGGQFTQRGEAPPWLIEYNRLHPLDDVHNAAWMALGAAAEAPPLRSLTYDSAHPEQFQMLYRASPFAQSAQFELVRELIARERLGQGDTLDLLVLSLDALNWLGYEVGADSPLVDQMVLHLDQEIEGTLEALNKAPGAGSYALAFAGAHGAPPAPDPERRARFTVNGEALARSVDRALAERYDTPVSKAIYVERYIYPFLYLRRETFRNRNPREMRDAAGRAAMANSAVAGFYTADGDCSHPGDWERRFRNSFHAARSGDVMLSYAPGCVEDFGAGRGVSYGSLYNYDARVPLMFYGPQFRSGVFEEPVESVDVAATLARVAGAVAPSSCTGRVLAEAFARTSGLPQ
jgi:hypothetical protein